MTLAQRKFWRQSRSPVRATRNDGTARPWNGGDDGMSKTTTVREAFQAMEEEQTHGTFWLGGRAIGDIQQLSPNYFMLTFNDGGDDAVEGGTEIEQDS